MGAYPSLSVITDLDPLHDLESNKSPIKGGSICENEYVCCIDSIESKAIPWSFDYEGTYYTNTCPVDTVLIVLFLSCHFGLLGNECCQSPSVIKWKQSWAC